MDVVGTPFDFAIDIKMCTTVINLIKNIVELRRSSIRGGGEEVDVSVYNKVDFSEYDVLRKSNVSEIRAPL